MPRGHHFSVADVQALVLEHGATPLFDTYKNRVPLRFRCAAPGCTQEGHIRIDQLRNMTPDRSLFCVACQKQWFASQRRIPIEQVRAEFAQQGAELLSTVYTGLGDSLRFRCATPGCTKEHSVIYRNFRSGFNARLLCQDCIDQNRPRGPEHPLWDQSLTTEHRLRTQKRPAAPIKQWYRSVLAVHDYTCVISGQRGRGLAAHHLYNYADYPNLAFDISNGVCVSRALHREFHSIYGRKHNTLDQFLEFARTKGSNYVPTRHPIL